MAPSGPLLLRLLLLPFNATVLELSAPSSPAHGTTSLHPDASPSRRLLEAEGGSGSSSGGEGREGGGAPQELYERLSRAAGVTHYRLECAGERAGVSGGAAASGMGVRGGATGSERKLLEVEDSGGGEEEGRGERTGREGAALGAWGLAEPFVACDGESVRSAMEAVQHSLFRSSWFDPSLLLPGSPEKSLPESAARVGTPGTKVGYTGGLPGTRVDSPEAIERLREWQECVQEKGRWVLDETPRLLPWEFKSSVNMCDNRARQMGMMAGIPSDKFVAKGGSAEDWNVRESLKYVWKVPKSCGAWGPVLSREWCQSKASREGKGKGEGEEGDGSALRVTAGPALRRILFLGDSLQVLFSVPYMMNCTVLSALICIQYTVLHFFHLSLFGGCYGGALHAIACEHPPAAVRFTHPWAYGKTGAGGFGGCHVLRCRSNTCVPS